MPPPPAPRLTPQRSAREPELISDGGGLPFAPAAPLARFEPLDPGEPPVQALLEQINIGRRLAGKKRLFRPRAPLPEISDAEKLAGWRVLARAEDELLYAKGRPPRLLTVAVSRRRDRWSPLGASNSRPLRASRDGTRASSWRLDPDFPVTAETIELHLLVTEQTRATGRLADDRMLPPDLYVGPDELVLRLYVKALEGYTGASKRHETAVTVVLPEPVGGRAVVDGALYTPPGAAG